MNNQPFTIHHDSKVHEMSQAEHRNHRKACWDLLLDELLQIQEVGHTQRSLQTPKKPSVFYLKNNGNS